MVKSWWQCLHCDNRSILRPLQTMWSLVGSLLWVSAVARIRPVSSLSHSFSIKTTWNHSFSVRWQWLPQQVFQNCPSPILSLLGEPATWSTLRQWSFNSRDCHYNLWPARDRKVSSPGFYPILYWGWTCRQRRDLKTLGLMRKNCHYQKKILKCWSISDESLKVSSLPFGIFTATKFQRDLHVIAQCANCALWWRCCIK